MQHFLKLPLSCQDSSNSETIDIFGQVWGVVLCILGCLPASLVSMCLMWLTHHSPPLVTSTNVSLHCQMSSRHKIIQVKTDALPQVGNNGRNWELPTPHKEPKGTTSLTLRPSLQTSLWRNVKEQWNPQQDVRRGSGEGSRDELRDYGFLAKNW